MNELLGLQHRFLDYLRRGGVAIENDIAGSSAGFGARRLSIYYNAYRARLRASIETDHPVLGVMLGDDAFDEMAAAYIEARPSSQTSLRNFCSQLPDFLRETDPYARVPLLSELASFERLLLDVFDATDHSTLKPDFFTKLAPDEWPGLQLAFHPSMRVFVSSWNSVDLWKTIKAEETHRLRKNIVHVLGSCGAVMSD